MLGSSFGKVTIDKKVDGREKGTQIVWDHESVIKAKQSINDGFNLKHSPFHEGNDIDWRRGNISYKYNEWELSEIKKCKSDILHFAKTYCKLMTDNGYQNVTLRDYQEDLLMMFQHNKENIALASRQVGKTTTTTIFLAWFLCFHFDKNCFFLANKNETVIEIVDKTQKVIKLLPFFLKPGVLNKTQKSIVFDNGSRLKSQSTTKKSSIGDTIHLLYVDEFAHIDKNIQKDFWENVYPTLSSSKISRIILTSTANGKELFYNIFKDSRPYDKITHRPQVGTKTKDSNSFVHMRIDYWQVPGRDEVWKAKEIKNFGGGEVGERAFNQQYGNQFLNDATVLLEAETLARLEKLKTQYKFKIIDVFEDYNEELDKLDKIKYDELKWHKNFNPNDIDPDDRFVFSIDISEGEEGDYSVLNIFRVGVKKNYKKIRFDPEIHKMYDFFNLTQVGIMRSNIIDTTKFARLIYHSLFSVFPSENVKIILEWNTYGSELYLKMTAIHGDNNLLEDSYFIKTLHRNEATIKKIGVKSRPGYKNIICDNLKLIMQNNDIEVNEEYTVDEASGFGKNKNGTYSGQLGHDDVTITIVYAGVALQSTEFQELVEEYFDYIPEEIKQYIDITLNQEEKEINSDIYDYFNDDEPSSGIPSLSRYDEDDDDWI